MPIGGVVKLQDGGLAFHTGFKAPDVGLDSEVIWELPNTDGSVGQALVTNGDKKLGWSNLEFDNSSIQVELDDTQNIIGEIVNDDGSFNTIVFSTTNYLESQTTVTSALIELDDELSKEYYARVAADTSLQSYIDTEVANEITARMETDNSLQSELDTTQGTIGNMMDGSGTFNTTIFADTNYLVAEGTVTNALKRLDSEIHNEVSARIEADNRFVAELTLTPQDISSLDGDSTIIEIIAAPTDGSSIRIVYCQSFLSWNTAQYYNNSSSAISLKFENDSNPIIQAVPYTMLTAANDYQSIQLPVSPMPCIANTRIVVFSPETITLGNSDVKLRVIYEKITLLA